MVEEDRNTRTEAPLMRIEEMTEEDVKHLFITPAIHAAGWDPHAQMRLEYFFTDGRVIVNGHHAARGERKKADYLLYYKRNLPLAIVEAKDANHCVGAGMQQALDYARILDVPFAYSSNGKGFLEHDMKRGVERELLEALLEKYGETGIMDIGDTLIFSNDPFRTKFGSEIKIAKAFGGREGLMRAIKELEDELYAAA